MVAHFPDGSLKCFLVKVVVRPKDVSMGPERLGRESVKDFFCTSLRKVCEPPKGEFHGISPVKIFHCNPLIHQVIAGRVEKVQLLTLFSGGTSHKYIQCGCLLRASPDHRPRQRTQQNYDGRICLVRVVRISPSLPTAVKEVTRSRRFL